MNPTYSDIILKKEGKEKANDTIFKSLNTTISTEKKIVEAENKNTNSANQVRVDIAKRHIRLADEATTPEEAERHLNMADQEADKISIENDKSREANEKHSKRENDTIRYMLIVF